MPNHLRRIRQLEARYKDTRGLVPHSEEWFHYWGEKLKLFLATRDHRHIEGMTIEYVHAIVTRDRQGHRLNAVGTTV